jgi:ElaB/YqjD/DUF883 family membrane-anchored ribosome-binding protein
MDDSLSSSSSNSIDADSAASAGEAMAGQNSFSSGDGQSASSIDGTGGSSRFSGVRNTANDLVQQAKEQAQEKLGDAKAQISAAAEPLKDDARDFAGKKKRQGAARISDLAKAVHGAADEVGKEVPKAAQYIHAGAQRLDDASDMLRNKSLDQLLSGANRAAHDRPLTFIAASIAAGFLLARFLRSSSGPTGVP